MPRSFWQRPFIRATASLALAAGIACAVHVPHHAVAGPGHSARVVDFLGRDGPDTDCGTGGAGGKGGDGGSSGQGGHGGAGGNGGVQGGDGGAGGDAGGQGGGPGQPGEPGKPGAHGCSRFEDLPDKPKEKLTPADKVRIVLVVLHGPTTSAQAAEKYKMSVHEIDTWIDQYRAHDWAALAKQS